MVKFRVYMFERAGFATVHKLDPARVKRERSLHCSRGRIDPSVLQRVYPGVRLPQECRECWRRGRDGI